MSPNNDKEDKFLMSLSDIVFLFRKNKFKILTIIVLAALIGAFYALAQPIKYKAEGTFRERSNKSGNVGGALSQLLSGDGFSLGGGNQDHESVSLIKSRKLLKEVIDKLNLQASLVQPCENEGILSRIRRNLAIEWMLLIKSPYPVLKDLSCPIQVDKVQYAGELPLFFDIYFQPDESYEVFDQFKHSLGKGYLDTPFTFDNLSFILKKTSDLDWKVLSNQFNLTIHSLANTATLLTKNLGIENTKTDKNVLKLTFEHRNRHFASLFVNTLMEAYQDYLKKNHDRIASIQLGYLHSKEEEAEQKLGKLMQKHADVLSNDLSTAGFADSEKEIDFLAESEHRLKDKLLANELEIKRLKNIDPNHIAYYDHMDARSGDHIVINEMLRDIRLFRQEQEALELALQTDLPKNRAYLEQVFDQQLFEIQQIQRHITDLQKIIERYKLGLDPDFDSPLLDDNRFLIKNWFDKLRELAYTNKEEWQKAREQFSFYLENLARLFNVHKKILQDRLTHQQNPSGEYQGINLETAKVLYVEYCKNLLNIESEIRQNRFFIDQLEDPIFEITSLSAGLRDSVSIDMINKTSTILLKLKDQSNQSIKEQERLKQELDLQRTFLQMHLKQMITLMELNKQLIHEKVESLQMISLELIRQKIALLEKNLHEYVQARLENFNQERTLMQQHLDQIRQEMATLPDRWIMEQMIEQQVDVNQLIVKEIAKMVESKNISHNLEVIQSAPIDIALSPVHPVPPGLKFYTLLGAILGAFLAMGFVLAKSLVEGIPVSIHNLKLLNQHVSGELSHLDPFQTQERINDKDLDTLRRLYSYFNQAHFTKLSHPSAILLLLIEGTGPDYTRNLANLLLKKGKKVLTIDVNFDNPTLHHQSGLLQYLEGEVNDPIITSDEYGDHIEAGGVSRFSIELLNSQRFKNLIEKLQEMYDWILVVSHALPRSVNAESLMNLFPFIAITVENEKLEDLMIYTDLSSKTNKKVTFIFKQSQNRKNRNE